MNKFELFACDQIFHSYPENKTFAEICQLCENEEALEVFNESLENTDEEDQQMILCERYETEWWSNIPILLKELANNAKYHFEEQK